MLPDSPAASPFAIPAIDPSPRPFAIPPRSRLSFISWFLIMTGVGWLIESLIFHSLPFPMLSVTTSGGNLLSAAIQGTVSGAIVGAMQWLVLRRYFSNWVWILATSLGTLLFFLMTSLWLSLVDEALVAADWLFSQSPAPAALARWMSSLVANSPSLLGVSGTHVLTLPSPDPTFTAAIAAAPHRSVFNFLLRPGLFASLGICLSIPQWLVLRRSARSVWWWVLIPPFALLMADRIWRLADLFSFLGTNVVLTPEIVSVGYLAATQAICLCLCRRKLPQSAIANLSPSRSRLISAPAITDRQQVNRLAAQLYQVLNARWETGNLSYQHWIYLVGVTADGTVAACEPANTIAAEQMDETPLPDLIAPADKVAPSPESIAQLHKPLARLQVVFTSMSTLEVFDCRGIPLWQVAIAAVVGIPAIDTIARLLALY